MARAFIFPTNPRRFDLEHLMVSGHEEDWRLTNNFRPGETQVRRGDIVYMMRTDDGSSDPPRLYGWAEVLTDEPVPMPDWRDKRDKVKKRPATPHATRIRFQASAWPAIRQSAFDAHEVARDIKLRQGTSQIVSPEEAEALDDLLRQRGVHTPGDGPDALARSRHTELATQNWSEALPYLAQLLDDLDLNIRKSRSRVSAETGPAMLLGSDDLVGLLLTPEAEDHVASTLFREIVDIPALAVEFPAPRTIPETALLLYPKEETALLLYSEEIAAFAEWCWTISKVALGQADGIHPAALFAALLTKRDGKTTTSAYEFMNRRGWDLRAARKRLFESWTEIPHDPDRDPMRATFTPEHDGPEVSYRDLADHQFKTLTESPRTSGSSLDAES